MSQKLLGKAFSIFLSSGIFSCLASHKSFKSLEQSWQPVNKTQGMTASSALFPLFCWTLPLVHELSFRTSSPLAQALQDKESLGQEKKDGRAHEPPAAHTKWKKRCCLSYVKECASPPMNREGKKGMRFQDLQTLKLRSRKLQGKLAHHVSDKPRNTVTSHLSHFLNFVACYLCSA